MLNRRFAWFLLRRLMQAVLIVVVIAIVNFCLVKLAPGDAADVLAGEAGVADASYVAHLKQEFGLDRPNSQQLASFLWRLAQGDLGWSFRNGRSVASLIFERVPATLLLMGTSLTIAVVLGTILGVVSARYVGQLADGIISFFTLIFYAIPLFWAGLMLIVLFSVKLGWVPTGGMRDPTTTSTGWSGAADVLRHLALPAFTLSFFFLALYTRLMRASMLEIYGMDYVRLARAKGLSESRIAFRHVLRNALLPLVTMVGMQAAAFLGGSVLIETVFSWPGLGRLMFEAVFQRDLNLLLSILVLSSIFVVIVNVVVDVLYMVLNPTIEVR